MTEEWSEPEDALPGGEAASHGNVIVLADLDRSMRRRGPGADITDFATDLGVEERVIRGAFPGGRDEIFSTVIGTTCDEFDEVVTDPMRTAPTRADALREAADGLAAYYEGGARHCLFDLFSVPAEARHLGGIEQTAQRFLDALTAVFVRDGKDEAAARHKALRLFAELQGTLVLSRLTGDTGLFRAFTDSLAKAR